jgi:hypothetical protein
LVLRVYQYVDTVLSAAAPVNRLERSSEADLSRRSSGFLWSERMTPRGSWKHSAADEGSDWEQEMARWMAPFLAALGHKGRRRWAPVYMEGLLGPGDRKSVQPMAARIAPNDHEQLHHFIATSAWDPAPLETALAHEAERLVGGSDAVLIIDDTSLLKQGTHSVGVARQYSGQAGKRANCQTLVWPSQVPVLSRSCAVTPKAEPNIKPAAKALHQRAHVLIQAAETSKE